MSDSPDKFTSIEGFKQTELKIKGSKFIACAFSVENEKDVENLIQKTKKEFSDATHHCFAYRIRSRTGDNFKTSDAREPRGTAGKPILRAIQSKNLYNILVVVTRYFGGTKLGKGGLSRAYRQSALEVLEKSRLVEGSLTKDFSIFFPLGLIGKISQVLDRYGAKILERDLGDEGCFRIEVRLSQEEKVVHSLLGATGGQVKFEK